MLEFIISIKHEEGEACFFFDCAIWILFKQKQYIVDKNGFCSETNSSATEIKKEKGTRVRGPWKMRKRYIIFFYFEIYKKGNILTVHWVSLFCFCSKENPITMSEKWVLMGVFIFHEIKLLLLHVYLLVVWI